MPAEWRTTGDERGTISGIPMNMREYSGACQQQTAEKNDRTLPAFTGRVFSVRLG